MKSFREILNESKVNWIQLESELGLVKDGKVWVLVDLEDNTVYDKESFESKFDTTIEKYFKDIDDIGEESNKFDTKYLKYPDSNLTNTYKWYNKTIEF